MTDYMTAFVPVSLAVERDQKVASLVLEARAVVVVKLPVPVECHRREYQQVPIANFCFCLGGGRINSLHPSVFPPFWAGLLESPDEEAREEVVFLTDGVEQFT